MTVCINLYNCGRFFYTKMSIILKLKNKNLVVLPSYIIKRSDSVLTKTIHDLHSKVDLLNELDELEEEVCSFQEFKDVVYTSVPNLTPLDIYLYIFTQLKNFQPYEWYEKYSVLTNEQYDNLFTTKIITSAKHYFNDVKKNGVEIFKINYESSVIYSMLSLYRDHPNPIFDTHMIDNMNQIPLKMEEYFSCSLKIIDNVKFKDTSDKLKYTIVRMGRFKELSLTLGYEFYKHCLTKFIDSYLPKDENKLIQLNDLNHILNKHITKSSFEKAVHLNIPLIHSGNNCEFEVKNGMLDFLKCRLHYDKFGILPSTCSHGISHNFNSTVKKLNIHRLSDIAIKYKQDKILELLSKY